MVDGCGGNLYDPADLSAGKDVLGGIRSYSGYNLKFRNKCKQTERIETGLELWLTN
jgi:hypothetical protein